MKPPTSSKLSRTEPANLADNPRASLLSWTKFEPYVISAIQRHPQPYILTPSHISAETFVSRIRDAIRGKIAFDYPSLVSTDQVRDWYAKTIVKRVNQVSVYIGPKQKLNEVVNLATEKTTTPTFDTLDASEIAAFALLLSNGRLSGPFVIQKPPPLDSIPSYPNFQTVSRPDGSLVLL